MIKKSISLLLASVMCFSMSILSLGYYIDSPEYGAIWNRDGQTRQVTFLISDNPVRFSSNNYLPGYQFYPAKSW